ncbi:MAG: WD40 repeat domain-containing protein, partial [Cyanobacteria bacterium J06643_5]
VWNIKTGEQKYIKKGRSEFDAVSFSFDGETIAAASFDNTIKLWDAQTGENNRTLKGHNNKVSSISFSRDNKLLASASYDKTVKIWNLETGKVKYTFDGHTAKVESVSFSPNGKIVASGSADKTIKLWDVITGKEIKTFAGHKSDVLTLRFNSNKDNPILASGSADEKIILWKIPSQDQIALAENVNLKSLISQGCEWTHDYLENNSNVPENDKHLCDDIDSTPMFEINGFDNNLIQHFVWNQLLSAKKSILQILNYFVQNKLS